MPDSFQIINQNAAYLLTFQVVGGADVFTRKSYRDIHQNPVRSAIVENEHEYLYSSARNFSWLNAYFEIDEI